MQIKYMIGWEFIWRNPHRICMRGSLLLNYRTNWFVQMHFVSKCDPDPIVIRSQERAMYSHLRRLLHI